MHCGETQEDIQFIVKLIYKLKFVPRRFKVYSFFICNLQSFSLDSYLTSLYLVTQYGS